MRHKRSNVSQQRRFIKRLVVECAFQDRQRSETVNILSREAIAASANQAFGYVARAENPRCPYVALIRECRMKIDRIEKALIGEDMKSGLVADVNSMKSTWRAVQPYVLVATTALLTWLVSHVRW